MGNTTNKKSQKMTGSPVNLADINQMNIISQRDLDVKIQLSLSGTSRADGSRECSAESVEVKSL